ncbi:DUF6527 family protein [Pseudooceanicola sp.]|uniref:DUF6527 family protein n=1 Tax=Pseudooceanicola sp. TaxID=1914328 RepID=UPI0035C6C355
MARLGKRLRSMGPGVVGFMCPGCDMIHHVTVDGSRGWSWNGNPDTPTFSPSILVKGTRRITDDEHARIMAGEKVEPEPLQCHSFVENGRVRFLNDCTHGLVGKTVDLPEIETP